MPDWPALVKGRLGSTPIRVSDQQAVVELADHLEDIFLALVALGVPEPLAMEQALEEMRDVEELFLGIHTARQEEGEMNKRTRSFWIPGLVTLTVSMLWLLALQNATWPSSSPGLLSSPPLLPYTIWLCSQPIFGALGGYISLRAGGSTRTRFAASAFPSAALLGLLLFVWSYSVFGEKNPFVLDRPWHFLLVLLPWAAFPAAASLAGALLLEGLQHRYVPPGSTDTLPG